MANEKRDLILGLSNDTKLRDLVDPSQFDIEWTSRVDDIYDKEYSVVLLDFNSEAIPTIQKVRQHRADIAIIAVTNHQTAYIDRQAQKLGLDDFMLSEELTHHLVEKTLSHVLDKRKLQKLFIEQQALISKQTHSALLSDLNAAIAHEIGTPLAVINAVSTLLNTQLETQQLDPASIQKSVDRIRTMSQRVTKVINGLRRIHSSRSQNGVDTAQLKQLIQDAVDLCNVKIERLNIDLIVRAPNDLKIVCRPFEITQVLTNMINNSCDAISELEERFIEIEVTDKFDSIQLILTDSGNGLDSDIVQKIWQPYFSTKLESQGMGLGMSICQRIVSSHFGQIVYNEKCPRTQFIITLPKDINVLEGKKILIVEDDPDFRSMIVDALTQTQSKLTVAENGPQALQLFRENTFDVIATDINIPGMNGLKLIQEVVQTIGENEKKPKVIIFSGAMADTKEIQQLPLDVTFLAKPFDLQEFLFICLSDSVEPKKLSV